MNHSYKLTCSQIRYVIGMYRLSKGEYGIKNVELAGLLNLSKPSVHNMLKALTEMGIVRQESFRLAHFTEDGLILAQKYETCFSFLEQKMIDLCGDGAASENAICGLLADMPAPKLNELYELQRNKKERFE